MTETVRIEMTVEQMQAEYDKQARRYIKRMYENNLWPDGFGADHQWDGTKVEKHNDS